MAERVFPAGLTGVLALVAACSSGAGASHGDGEGAPGDASGMETGRGGSDAGEPSSDGQGPGEASLAMEAAAPDAACATSGAQLSSYDALGQGTASAPYVLCNATQLVDLSGTPAAWKFAFRLAADVNLGAHGTGSASPFTMIGTTAQPFTGTFDGGGHIISNLMLSMSGVHDVGFFGVILGGAAVVQSLGLTGAVVSGYEDVGILAGRCDRGGRILGSSSEGSVQGHDNVGGLLGSGLYGTVISSSWSTATVTGTDSRIGGLAGSLSTGQFVFNSFATGSVTGTSSTGGLFGSTDSGAIYNSYSTATVTSTSATADGVGGAVGTYHGSIYQNCFATGNVTAQATSTVGRFVGDAPFGTLTNDFDLAASTCQKGGTACASYPMDVSLAQLQDKTSLPLSGWDLTSTWVWAAGAFPTLHSALFDATTWSGCSAHAADTPVAGGDGTPDRPYLICSAAQFAKLSSDSTLTSGVYLLQMAPIDFTAGPALQPISPFVGVYNGNGQPLSNFTVQGNGGVVGLFGNATGAIVRTAVENGTVTASGSATSTGMIVGSLYGVLADSYATGTVSGPADVGGLGNAHSTIGCYASATVTASDGAAGGLNVSGGPDGVAYDIFASSSVSASGGTAFDLTPTVSSPAQLGDAFYDSSKCGGCTNVDAMGEPTSYFYSQANPPLSNWDFDTIWTAHANGFPTLR